jgi:excisionase family DNA binding protein
MTRDDYEWVTLKQYARELGVSDKTVRRWIRHGKVVAVQHERRGHWRIRIQKEAKAS